MGMGKVEARKAGLILTLGQERAMGQRAPFPAGHGGGVQPTTHAANFRIQGLSPEGQLAGDEQWARTLIDSGLELRKLDQAMKAESPCRLNKLCIDILKSTPEPGSKAASLLKELQKLTSGVSGVAYPKKFKRIKPLYWQARELATPN